MKKLLDAVNNRFMRLGMLAVIGPLADVPPGIPLPPAGGLPNGLTLEILRKWLETISIFMMWAGVVIAVIFIVWGGIGFMLAGGNAEKAGKAKTRLFNGIIGALIVLGVGLILRTVAALVAGGALV